MAIALADLRKANNLTQEQLAKKTELTLPTIIAYEEDVKNLRAASYKTIERIAGVLDVSIDDIFLDSGSAFPKYLKTSLNL